MSQLWFSSQLAGLNFTEVEVMDALSNNKMLQLTLYTKGICNTKCPSCFISQNDDHYPELELDDYIKILKNSLTLGVKTIKISGAGEPLIVKEIIPLIDFCFENGLKIVIYTNGISLGDHELSLSIYDMDSYQLIDYLMSRNVSLVYKFNSSNDDIQDYLLGKKNYAGKLYRGIFNLLYKNFNSKDRLALQTIMTPYNKNEIEQMYRFCRNQNIIPYFETVLKKEKATEHMDLYLSDEENKLLFEKLCEIDQNEYNLQWFPVPSFVNFQCTELYYSMLVDNFGYIRVCAGVWECYGNFRENNLDYYWNLPSFASIRQTLDKKLSGKCKNCHIREANKCTYGCRAYSYINCGDMFGEYSECWNN